MAEQFTIPISLPVERSLVIDPPLTDDELERLCFSTDVPIERTKEGALIVHSPAGGFTGDGNAEIAFQLRAWWYGQEKGRVFDSSTGFFLPDGSLLNPDASYIGPDKSRLITREAGNHLLRMAPDFVVELLSYSDSLPAAKRKMESWIENGVQLAWLLDPYERQVWVYHPGQPERPTTDLLLSGSGPVEGFTLDLGRVWKRYEPEVGE